MADTAKKIDPRADRIAALQAELDELKAGETAHNARYDKSYRVEVVGATGKPKSLQPAIVERCCDESEAKRLYFAAAGITDTGHYTVTVKRIKNPNPPPEGDDAEEAPEPKDAVTFDEPKDAEASDEELEGMTKDELKEVAESRGVEIRSDMRKDEIIEAIRKG